RSGPAGDAEQEVAKEIEVRSPRLPAVKIDECTASRYEDHLNLTFGLAVENANSFPVSVKRVSYRIQIEGKEMESEEVPGQRVAAGRSAVLELSQKVDEVSFPEVRALLKKNAVEYRLSGKVVLDEGTLDFD